MKEKFNEWRNQLTRRQKDVLCIASGIISMMLFVGLMIVVSKTAKIVSEMPPIIKTCIKVLEGIGLIVSYAVGMILIVYGLSRLIDHIGDEFTKNRLLKLYNEKINKDEFIEVFFRDLSEGPSGDAGELYWYSKNCSMPHFFAKWEDEKIYVVLKDNDKFVKDWIISKLIFFDNWFNLSN